VLIIGGASACGSSTEPSSPPDSGNSRFPLLSNGGGHVLSPLRLVTVIAANDLVRDSLFAFTKAIASSRWWKEVAGPYGISQTTTAVTVTGPAIAPGTNFTFSDVPPRSLSKYYTVQIASIRFGANGEGVVDGED